MPSLERESHRIVIAGASSLLGAELKSLLEESKFAGNVIQIDAFSALFDGFSIGSNDLTQLTLGVDRDSEIVSFDFNERDPGMLEMLRLAVGGASRNHRKIGICGEAPANYPEITQFLVEIGIDSISVNPSSVLRTIEIVRDAELAHAPIPQTQTEFAIS